MEKMRGMTSIVAGGVRRFAVLALCAALLGACAAPAAVGYAPRSDEETYVVQTVQSMAEALNAGDVPRFMAKVSDGYYKGYKQLEKRLNATLAGRLNYSLSLSVEEISLDDSKVNAAVVWKSQWVSKSAMGKESAQGRTRLVFMKGMGIKLIDQSEETLFGL